MIHKVMLKMIDYNYGCPELVNHALKVYGFAKIIGEEEHLPEKKQMILEMASVLHDIGIRPSEAKYQSCSGKYQEIEGPPIALKLLKDCNVPEDMVQRICFLIAHHHTYQSVDDIDYQILIEADFLVNMFEEKMSKEQIQIAKEKYFKTQTGKQLVMDLYEREYPIPSIFASML